MKKCTSRFRGNAATSRVSCAGGPQSLEWEGEQSRPAPGAVVGAPPSRQPDRGRRCLHRGRHAVRLFRRRSFVVRQLPEFYCRDRPGQHRRGAGHSGVRTPRRAWSRTALALGSSALNVQTRYWQSARAEGRMPVLCSVPDKLAWSGGQYLRGPDRATNDQAACCRPTWAPASPWPRPGPLGQRAEPRRALRFGSRVPQRRANRSRADRVDPDRSQLNGQPPGQSLDRGGAGGHEGGAGGRRA